MYCWCSDIPPIWHELSPWIDWCPHGLISRAVLWLPACFLILAVQRPYLEFLFPQLFVSHPMFLIEFLSSSDKVRLSSPLSLKTFVSRSLTGLSNATLLNVLSLLTHTLLIFVGVILALNGWAISTAHSLLVTKWPVSLELSGALKIIWVRISKAISVPQVWSQTTKKCNPKHMSWILN